MLPNKDYLIRKEIHTLCPAVERLISFEKSCSAVLSPQNNEGNRTLVGR